MTDRERRQIWSHVRVDKRTGVLKSRITEFLSTSKGRASLEAASRIPTVDISVAPEATTELIAHRTIRTR